MRTYKKRNLTTLSGMRWDGSNFDEVQTFLQPSLALSPKLDDKRLVIVFDNGDELGVNFGDYIIINSDNKVFTAEPQLFELIFEVT